MFLLSLSLPELIERDAAAFFTIALFIINYEYMNSGSNATRLDFHSRLVFI
jgi:hypothetical protein